MVDLAVSVACAVFVPSIFTEGTFVAGNCSLMLLIVGDLVGISISTNIGEACYIPTGHTKGMGYDVTIEASGDATPEGLTLYGGFSKVDQYQNSTAINDDISEWTAGVKYAVGSFTLGYQYSEEDNGRASTTTGYDNTGYGIVFAINDDLSISYNNYESEQKGTTQTTAEASSVQLAYSSGGLSVRFAEQTVDNKNYATAAANQRDARTISVALAF